MEYKTQKNWLGMPLSASTCGQGCDIRLAPRHRVFEIRRNILRKLLQRLQKSRVPCNSQTNSPNHANHH